MITLRATSGYVFTFELNKNNFTTYLHGRDLSVLGKHLCEVLLGEFFAEVFDEDIGESLGLLAQLLLPLLAGNEASDVDLLAIEQHAVDLLDGVVSGLLGLEVDKAVTLGVGVR